MSFRLRLFAANTVVLSKGEKVPGNYFAGQAFVPPSGQGQKRD
jgi:hypothetical protein